MMQKKILVLGGTGLLGAPVARRLQADGFGVRILARDTGKAGQLFDESFEIAAGDATDCESVKQAMMGCAGVHLTLNGEAELIGAQHVASLARTMGVERITYISGATACEENRWFPMTDAKMRAEEAIQQSGVPYTIFCPTWPMEMLVRYARGGQPFLIGDRFDPIHFFAADDMARMISTAYQTDDAENRRLIVHGPQAISMPDALHRYCAALYPNAEDIQIIPVEVAKGIAAQTGNKLLEFGAAITGYFEKVGELGDPSEANALLGAPSVTLDDWLAAQHVN